MYTLIISTIGAPFILDAIKTLEKFPPSEVIVVLDKTGRSTTDLDQTYPIDQLESDLAKSPVNPKLVIHNPTPEKWAVMNGCYNVGWKLAKNSYVCFTHDDAFWADYDFPKQLNRIIQNIETNNCMIQGKRVMGIVLPSWEILNKVIVPMHGLESGTGKDWCLCQVYSPIFHILNKKILEELGGFDEDYGIWYDGQMQIESFQRDWWYIHLPTPICSHESIKTYKVNSWGGGQKFATQNGQIFLITFGVNIA